jgi:hypothetical protein
MRVKGMTETLCACPPSLDVAKWLPGVRTWCSGRAAAVGHSMYRHPIELSAASGPLARGANISCNRPSPAVAALKLRKGWTWPRRLPLGVRAAATSQPPRHGSGMKFEGLPLMGQGRAIGEIPRRCRPFRPGTGCGRPRPAALRYAKRVGWPPRWDSTPV